MAVWPFIISPLSKEELGEEVVRHEKIHFRQQLEMLFVPFFVWYTAEYFVRLMKLRDRHLAYRSISFEKEAFECQDSPDYLTNRRWFAWLKFL